MDSQLVSIIVPVYNSEKYLSHCVDSILRQSYRNLEILLIDDGSTDGSPALCDAYAEQDSRIVVRHQENGGISAAQNAGLDLAQGQYITFSDNDDILAVNNVEVLVEAIERSGADIAKGRWQQFGLSQIDGIIARSRIPQSPIHLTTFSHPLKCYQNIFCKSLRMLGGRETEAMYFNEANWCKLYRRELWSTIRFPLGRYAQDVAVTSEIYSAAHSAVDVDAVLYYWLQSESSVTHQGRNFVFFEDNILAGLHNFEECLDKGITPARSFYELLGSLRMAYEAKDYGADGRPEMLEDYWQKFRRVRSRLTGPQLLRCELLTHLRLLENVVYDHKIHNMK